MHGVKCRLNAARLQAAKPMFYITTTQNAECLVWAAPIRAGWGSFDTTVVSSAIKQLLETPSHPNMRWHYFMAWMMLSVKEWIHVFNINE